MLYMDSSSKFTQAIGELKNMMKESVSEDLETMDKTELEGYQSIVKTLDAMDDVIAEQQEALKTISNQLDELNKLLLEKGLV